MGLKFVSYEVISTDRYGRSIAKVFYDDKYLSKKIIKYGFGWHYKKYSSSNELSNLEIKARDNNIGLWIEKNPIAPWEYRKIKKNRN